MTTGTVLHQAHGYTVVTPVFEGPLDLLLHLIERAELDITRLALAQITDQYLEHIRQIPENVAEDVSAFLVIAARLLQIKSEVLLPRHPAKEVGEEDPGEMLARQLVVYKRFKELAKFLASRESANLRGYPRLAPTPQFEIAPDLSDLTLADIWNLARLVLLKPDERPALASVVAPPKITIREKIAWIGRYLRQNPHGSFSRLLSGKSFRIEIVVTFLALLELVKRQMVLVQQDRLFGEIQIEPAESWEDDTPIELEFGE